MATYTADQLINRALRLLGVLAEGETPSASESNDALMALNQMLDSWSTERLAVFSTLKQVFIWPAGQVSQTLGPSGTFTGTRPTLLDESSYFVVDGISYPLQIINDSQYNAIADKSTTASHPHSAYINPTVPNATIRLYPVPTQNIEVHFVSAAPLAEPGALTTELLLPPGYTRAFVYNLAMELAPEFGVEPSRQVTRIAVTSKRNIKRINDPCDVLGMAIPSVGGYFNIFSGG